jgi:hypothetical protein
MKLLKILETHNQHHSPNTFSNNLGDGFLYDKNSFYKTVRDHALKLGYKYSSDYNNSFVVLPYAQLEDIFKSKKILMLDNVSVFKNFNLKALNLIEWSEIETGYRRNYIFHESCHVIARDILKVDSLLNLLFEESFANTCEVFGMIQADTEIHRLFYETNSYSAAFSDAKKIKSIVGNLGAENVFKFTIMAYLHSNFLYSLYTKSEVKAVADYVFKCSVSSENLQQLQFMAQLAFSLDETFKQQTRRLHFKLNGLDESDFLKLKSEYLKRVLASQDAANILDTMAKVFYI